MGKSTSCIFCDIVRGAAEVSVCYEDPTALAFLDIQPVNPGHTLVVPREHFESLSDMPAELTNHLFQVATRLGPIVKKISKADGLNIVVNSGAAAGQDVFHYHVHIIPRKQGDGFDISLPFSQSDMPERSKLDACAARIHAELHDPMRRTPLSNAAVRN